MIETATGTADVNSHFLTVHQLSQRVNSGGDSHDEDGGGDERGGVETSLTVGVLPLPLVHLPSTVLTAATHTETCANDGSEDHEHNADGPTYEETSLVVDPLQGHRIHPITIVIIKYC